MIKKLLLYSLNSQSLANKIALLAVFIKDHDPDVLVISETWLSPNIPSAEIFPPHYNASRKDRTDGYGGVLISYRSNIACYKLECNSSVELAACRFVLKDQTLIACSV